MMSSAETTTQTRAAATPPAGQPAAATVGKKRKVKKRRISTFWMKQIHTIHWMSSAICLVGLLLFAVTGFTLNHAADIEGNVETVTVEKTLPDSLAAMLAADGEGEREGPLPAEIADWAKAEMDADLSARTPEWTEFEVYVPLPRPGGDGWIAFDRQTGDVVAETTDRGIISFLNDLHKGRDTGVIWSWFIDIFAFGCLLFALSGLLLLYIHSRFRASTWPIVGAGLMLPLLIVILFVHV